MHQDFEKEAKGNSEMVYSLKFTGPKYPANDKKLTAKYEPIRIRSNLHGIYSNESLLAHTHTILQKEFYACVQNSTNFAFVSHRWQKNGIRVNTVAAERNENLGG